MIQLLRYQLSVHLRMISTYVMLLFIALAFGMIQETLPSEMVPFTATAYTSMLIAWITLTFVLQITGFQQVLFRPEALQYRIARLRNRPLIIGGALIHIVLLALVATLPFAVIYAGLVEDPRIVGLAWANMLLFYVFLGIATVTISRFTGTGILTPILVLIVLFLLPISLSAMGPLAPAFLQHPISDAIQTLLASHLDVSGNADMLILRGIQDTDAVLRTLILTPILATITYVHFQRGDHH